jgi:nitrate/nitrite transport system ATP-binding protein
VLEVDLLRPRDRLALAEDAAYNHYRAEVVKFLHERHSRTEAAARAPSREERPRLRLAANQ